MFKKFKDKLAEEMKQSPARIQASMQQLAQAVVSPNISNVSSSGLSASNDNFSLTEEGDETAKNSPAKEYFPSIDLTSLSSNTTGLSRSSSINSLTSADTSGLFPIFESSGSVYHFQSDVEQSASETDEYMSPKMEQLSKEDVYSAYRKIQVKYGKYRGKYRDLANHYREIERVKTKLESLLVETQNKALRRIENLKEQCQLEQQAKAHLEEALRNDIEEKDHIIDSLNTKVKLLQMNGGNAKLENQLNLLEHKVESTRNSTQDFIKISDEEMDDISLKSNQDTELLAENHQLKNKLEKFEILISKYKESLKRSKEKIEEMEEEKYKIERELEMTKSLNEEKLDELKKDLSEAKEKIDYLNEEINELRKREEESVISLAENKFKIHKELEIKEEQIKQLTLQLKNAIQNKEKADLDEKNHEINEKMNETTKDNLDVLKNESVNKINDKDSKISELNKIIEDNKNKTAEISNLRTELNEFYVKIAGLNDTIEDNERTIDDFKGKETKQQIFQEKMVNYLKSLQLLKINCEDIKIKVRSDGESLNNKFSNVNKHIFNLLSNYEASNDKKRNDLNNKLIAEVENLNFKIYDLEKELQQNKNYIKTMEEDNEKLKKMCNMICEEDKKEILMQKNLITKMSEEIGILKEQCENQGARLDQYNKEKKNNNEQSITELEKLRKLQNDCKKLVFDWRDNEGSQDFFTKIPEIIKENKVFKENITENEEKINCLMSECEEKTKENVKLRKELENERIMLETNLENCRKLETEKEKLLIDVLVLNEKITELENVSSIKNSFIEKLKVIENERNCTVDELNSKIEELLKNASENPSVDITLFDNRIDGLTDVIVAKIDYIEKLRLVNKEKDCFIEELKQKMDTLQSNSVIIENNDTTDKMDEIMDIIVAKNDYITSLKVVQKQKISAIKELEEVNEALQSENETLKKKCVPNDKVEELWDMIVAKNDFIYKLKHVKNENSCKITELNQKIQELESENVVLRESENFERKVDELMDIIVAKDDFIQKLKLIKQENSKIIEEIKLNNDQLQLENENLKHNVDLRVKFEELQDIIVTKDEFINQLKLVKDEKDNIIKELEQKNVELISQIENLEKENNLIEKLQIEQKALKDSKNKLSQSNEELKKAEEIATNRIKELDELLNNNSQQIDNQTKEMESLRNLSETYKSQIQDLEEKMEKLTIAINEERRISHQTQIDNTNNQDNKFSEEEVENLRSTVENLQKQLNETESMLTTCQSKESQIEGVNETLRSESDQLKQQLTCIEEEQRERMNQLVKEFQAQISDKDQELQAALDKKFERQKNYESDLVQQYKEQLKDFQVELTAKSEEIENLKKCQGPDSIEEVDKLMELVKTLKAEHENEMKEVETKWEEILKTKTNEISELKNEWNKSKRELENISVDTLKNTLSSQQRELHELRKVIKLRHDTLEDSTEIEYLRNILYEYMMGKETLVLAKVIAAVVKFDQDQTIRILKKEEDKLTLLGSLGLT